MIPIVSTVPTAGNGFVPVVESARGAVDVAQVSLFSVDAVMHGQCRAAAVRDAGDGAAQGDGAVMTLHDKHQVWRKLDPDQFSARVETPFFSVGPSQEPAPAHAVTA